MLRRLAIASFVLTAACAGQQKAGPAAPATVTEKTRITNQPPFDVAYCQPRQLSLPPPPNNGLLVGALQSTRPQVMECLVDPKNRGPAPTTKVMMKTSVTDAAATTTVTGENLTPEGQKCIQAIVDKAIQLQPLEKGAKPVEAQAEIVHELNNSPSVSFGINEGSDFSGAVRLAQEQWCECYAPFTTQAPPVLTAKVTLKKGLTTPAEVTFEPSGNTEADQLAACLKPKVAALPAKVSVDELTFPHRFIHFHSGANEALASLPPVQRFYQFEGIRNQRFADTAIALGQRASAAEVYDALVAKYQKTKDWHLGPELTEKCAVLVKAADAWIAAIQTQQSVEQQMVTLLQELKAQDEAWKDTEAKSQESLNKTQSDLEMAKKRRADDASICPKESGGGKKK